MIVALPQAAFEHSRCNRQQVRFVDSPSWTEP
jgi:hypothetical protein